jgi:hypothetical protein
MADKPKLHWEQKGTVSKAYPYEIHSYGRSFRIYWYAEHGYRWLAGELASRQIAKDFCQAHWERSKESA